MKNYYRIRTNVSKDSVVRATLTQDVDFLEILSLKIRQEDTYKLHVANYGVIVGRVLANDAFGIPNAKVSVFIELDDEDKLNSEISSLYPYATIQTKDSEDRRYNLLPDDSNDECYRVVGTFPNKRLVLDNDTEIEIFEKYWKYTTVTNKSGDYMIFGVPTGTHQVHVDVDLSDIGVLSQKPRDFMYKGYSITQFDNANQFKESTNLDNLSQLLSQTSSVYVYPFWGDSDVEEIAITRCDLQVQYKFEPTCVFFGCIVSDNSSNNIGDKCNPSLHVGFNRNLIAGEGTIEMIRKTQDGLIEECQIQGNRLIDGDGVWCYQIPMNLDYVGTDEFGNIVPTDNPAKGIPTRTSVRFRVSMQETSSDGVARHRAKYLIPNVQNIVKDNMGVYINDPNKYLQCYEFGSATLDEYFRDLYWNKVYSVKNYIPRIQISSSRNTQKYSAIRTVNSSDNLNPFPFNHARFRLYFAYRVLCILMTIVITIVCGLNQFVSKIAGISIFGFKPFSWICSILSCITITGGLSEDEDSPVEYFPCCSYSKCMKCSEPDCVKETKESTLINNVQQALSQEYDTVNLDFYNDWINGCLYLPLWFWKKTKKKKFFFGLFTKKAVNRYCNCDSNYKKLKVTENCSLYMDANFNVTNTGTGSKYHYSFPDHPAMVGHGIIKEVENDAGLKIYYYSPGVPNTNDYKDTEDEQVTYVRLYSTDIILLGSLNECDLDNLPRPFLNIPSSTANIPYISTLTSESTDEEVEESGTDNDNGVTEVTGMDWLGKDVNRGLLMDLTCVKVNTKPKSCINLARMSELGVSLDTRYYDAISENGVLKYDNERPADGMITRYELIDNETRAMFASLNHNGLVEKAKNPNTGYDTYKLIYNYPIDFDGHLKKYSESYTKKLSVVTYDNQDKAYVDYKFGIVKDSDKPHYYSFNTSSREYQMPLFNNSFYFYFGLNEGNTAIDKFNNMFYSECFKNYKYPFSLTYTSTPAKWCKEYNNATKPLPLSALTNYDIEKDEYGLSTDFATITVSINGIKLPFTYTLYDEYNTELVSENDMYNPLIKFGYDMTDGTYTDSKNGTLRNYSDNDYSTFIGDDDIEYVYLLDNGTYYLEVTDFNGNTIKQPITISQSSLMFNVTVIGLGDKYYDGITVEKDICNDYAYYGEIQIDYFNIDGKNYAIDAVAKNGNGYDISCHLSGDTNQVETVFIEIESLTNGISFSGCSCSEEVSNIESPILTESKVLSFRIWIPGDYKITVTQYCNGALNDNTVSETVNVPNGSPFITYLRETPMRFILGKNTDINNDNFYSKDVALKASDSQISGWFGVHKENTYKFEPVGNEDNLSVWSDYIETEIISDDEGNAEDISLTTKINILDFKFKCLVDMSANMYIEGTDEVTVYYTSSGGKSPILYRGCYPEYSLFTTDNINEDGYRVDSVIFDSDANVTCLANTPNIVGFNYTEYSPDDDIWYRVDEESPKFNNLFEDSEHTGNYFAAFTSNAGCVFQADETGGGEWITDNNVKYESNPFKADPYVPEVPPGESEYSSDYSYFNFIYGQNPYFRALTVDRRLDYSFFIIMPYNRNDLASISSQDVENGTDIWKNGRMVGYQYNGIEMAYDSNYNIVGKGAITYNKDTGNVSYYYGNTYEYYLPTLYVDTENQPSCFNENGEKLNIHYTDDIQNKKLYSCTLRCGRVYDIRTRFWGKGRNADVTDLNGLKFNVYDGDENDVNGDFSQENYPTIRRLDIYNIPSASRITYSAVNCKYESILDVIDNGGESYDYDCEVQEGSETTFNVSGNNNFAFVNDDLLTTASNGDGNVVFSCTANGGNATFEASKVDVSFRISEDNSNETHRSFTYIPFYNAFHADDANPYAAIKTIKMTSMPNLITSVMNRLDGKQLSFKSNVKSSSSDFKNQVSTTNKLTNDVFKANYNRYIGADSDATLYDDDSMVKTITYNFNKEYSLDSLVNTNPDIISLYYLRRYINSEYDNLSKDILTLNIGAFIDIRKFNMSCECEIEANTNRQITTFKIEVPSSSDYSKNQQFNDYENMSAAIKYKNAVSTNATISKDANDNSIIIRIVWDGDLDGITLESSAKDTELYIEMPNSLILKVKFKLNKNNSITR